MVKSSHILLRVDAEDKSRIEAAARVSGLNVTSFVLEVAMNAVEKIEARRATETVKHDTHGHCPAWFRGSCITASRGGTTGYRWVGYALGQHITTEIPYDLEDCWDERVEELVELLSENDDERVVDWFTVNLPSFIEMIPSKRREAFISGLREYSEECGFDLP